jgi:transcriptional regulator with XRE-family HTH domain
MMDNKRIGQYLLKKRKEETKTQKEVADELGVTYQAVSRWENGDSIPDIETLCMIADMYHVSVDEILQRNPQPIEKSQMILLAAMSGFVHVMAIICFIVINTLWIPLVGIAVFAVISLGGLVPANIYYFFELEEKSRNDTIAYIVSYVPAMVGLIIVLSSQFQ